MQKKAILLIAEHSTIEPLGLLYLSGLARNLGWEPIIHLSKQYEYDSLKYIIKQVQPVFLGFTLFTGNHLQVFSFLNKLNCEKKRPFTILGGPHPTYFPEDCIKYADYVVVSEGFNPFRRILRGQVSPGIVFPQEIEAFPIPWRERFYKDYPDHGKNPIKNIISMTGCPYRCTYCYNSSSVKTTIGSLLPSNSDTSIFSKKIGYNNRLFPLNKRDAKDVEKEIEDIVSLSPETKLIYWQDDIIGADNDFLETFSNKRFKHLEFHGQMRFELADPNRNGGTKRLQLLKERGFSGLTLAVESSDFHIRKELLGRPMQEKIIDASFRDLKDADFKIRTFQIIGLPLGATKTRTKINIEADLDVLFYNIKLKRKYNLPTIAWASTFVPYSKTILGDYSVKYGYVEKAFTQNPKARYFNESILRFPNAHYGPDLIAEQNNPEKWLSQNELNIYRLKNAHLRDFFPLFVQMSTIDRIEYDIQNYIINKSLFDIETILDFINTFIDHYDCIDQNRLFDELVSKGVDRDYLARTKKSGLLKGLVNVSKILDDVSLVFLVDILKHQNIDCQILSRKIKNFLYQEYLYAVGAILSE